MPLSISIRFLTGRAHLHHWHAHHSDGKVDWPPSPWRLMRALVAVAGNGLTTLPESFDENIEASDTDELPINRLANVLALLAQPPAIWLPHTSGGHTRQFFPRHEGGVVKSTGSAVFDSFAAVSNKTPIVFVWADINMLPEDGRYIDLQVLLRRLTYFGRAESWCEASASLELPSYVKDRQTHWCCVCINDNEKPPGSEYVDYSLEKKLVVEAPLDTKLRNQVAELLPECKHRAVGKSKNNIIIEKRKALNKLLVQEFEGVSLLRCLLRSSGEDIEDGLERPIGSRWIHYAVPRAIYQIPEKKFCSPMTKPHGNSSVTLVRFFLNTATVNRPVLPLFTDTLLVADKFRSAALAWHGHLYDNGDGLADTQLPRNLRGREDDGARIKGQDHAFFWPTDDDGDGFIDHITAYCPSGFRQSEVDAMQHILRIHQRSGRPDLLVTPVFTGSVEDFGPWKGEAKQFVSATPYFCPVHLSHGKKNGEHRRGGKIRSVEKEFRKGLSQCGIVAENSQLSIHELVFPENADNGLEPLNHISLPSCQGTVIKSPDAPLQAGYICGIKCNKGNHFVRCLDFCRRRRNHEVHGTGRMFLLEFNKARPARPFAIGSQSHFGLGLFVPVETKTED